MVNRYLKTSILYHNFRNVSFNSYLWVYLVLFCKNGILPRKKMDFSLISLRLFDLFLLGNSNNNRRRLWGHSCSLFLGLRDSCLMGVSWSRILLICDWKFVSRFWISVRKYIKKYRVIGLFCLNAGKS
jgi:ABC-type antimicrobial peptide transport system ATPase subunit